MVEPRHKQIAADLRRRIEPGELPPWRAAEDRGRA